MTPEELGLPQEAIVERHNDGFWSILGEWIRDLNSQDVPGSVVLLIVVLVMARELIGVYMRIRTGGRSNHDH